MTGKDNGIKVGVKEIVRAMSDELSGIDNKERLGGIGIANSSGNFFEIWLMTSNIGHYGKRNDANIWIEESGEIFDIGGIVEGAVEDNKASSCTARKLHPGEEIAMVLTGKYDNFIV